MRIDAEWKENKINAVDGNLKQLEVSCLTGDMIVRI